MKNNKTTKIFLLYILLLSSILLTNMTIANDYDKDVNKEDDSIKEKENNQLSSKNITLHFFCDETIPSCIEQKTYNSKLQKEFPNLKIKNYQPFISSKDKDVYIDMTSNLNIEPKGVPITIIENKTWEGFIPRFYLQMQEELQSMMNITTTPPKNTNNTQNIEDITKNNKDYYTNKINHNIIKLPILAFFIILIVALLILVTSIFYMQLIPSLNNAVDYQEIKNKQDKTQKNQKKPNSETKKNTKKKNKNKTNKSKTKTNRINSNKKNKTKSVKTTTETKTK